MDDSRIRRAARHLGLLAALGISLLVSCSRAPADRRTNVILISLDTLRADHVGAWGYPEATSPHLDRLARRSWQARMAIAQSASTLPSHRSLFQSRVASRFEEEAPVLAEILREAGWATVAFTGGGNVAAELGFGRGFDIYEESNGGFAWAVPAFESWLDARADDPFFAFLHTYDVHLPYDPPPPHASVFDPGYTGPVTGPRTREICRKIRRVKEYADYEGPTELTESDRRHMVALYDGELLALDRWVGRLLAVLESRSLRENTAIFVTSDHGEEFWDHGSLIHSHTVYQELIHVPFLVALPGGADGALIEETVRNLEIAPTILDLLELSPMASHQGVSLLPRFSGGPSLRLPAVAEMKSRKAFLVHPWKLIADAQARTRSLYDLEQDPAERNDVSAENRELVEDLQEMLSQIVARGEVDELSSEALSDDLQSRLRALGYLD